MLRDDFVVGWTNIRKSGFVGYSHGYSSKQTSVGTTNGAGGRNTQIFVLAPDRTVLHALPGFWHPEDLARELRFAKLVAMLWADRTKTRETKERMLARMHRREVYQQPPETYARSSWQSFDEHAEQRRLSSEIRDTALRNDDGTPFVENGRFRLKPLNVLVHERMARRPFVPWDEFDVESFVDYGRYFYDINFADEGRTFAGQAALQRKRERAERRRRRG